MALGSSLELEDFGLVIEVPSTAEQVVAMSAKSPVVVTGPSVAADELPLTMMKLCPVLCCPTSTCRRRAAR